MELQALIRKFNLPREFSAEVESEAATYGDEVKESAYAERENLFQLRTFTIDGADAKDFDDAVSLERWPEGNPTNRAVHYRLGVHIADVAEYVREHTPLDEEAFRRGTSVYLAGAVLPMLPFSLSDGLCSLRPDRVRLTLSCVMDLDASGRVLSDRIFESAIRSGRRFTYEQVESILKGEATPSVSDVLQEDVREMQKLAKILRTARFGRGSLDFDFPEAYVQTDPQGRPLDIRKRERLEAHRLIEDFMLLANETVARHFQRTPFLYRIHETPDPLKLARLKSILEAVGIQAPRTLDSGNPAALQQVLKSSEGKPVQAMVHTSVLRSLKQAVYSDVNRGHFGLASKCYTHFTSPIRRYPDLIVHRMVKAHLHGNYQAVHWKTALPQIGTHCSQRERLAVGAEREYLDLQRVRFMEKHVGEQFDGVVTGVTNFGFFVQLNDYFVEGLVHVSNLQGDYYVYDELRMTLRGKRSGQSFSMGQRVRILIASANTVKRQLDFELVPQAREPKPTTNVNPGTRRPPWPNVPKKNEKRKKNRGRRRH